MTKDNACKLMAYEAAYGPRAVTMEMAVEMDSAREMTTGDEECAKVIEMYRMLLEERLAMGAQAPYWAQEIAIRHGVRL